MTKKYCFQFRSVDWLIGWRFFYLISVKECQGGRKGEKWGAPKERGEQQLDYHGTPQASELLSANNAERPAASTHGVKEIDLHPRLERLAADLASRSTSEVSM